MGRVKINPKALEWARIDAGYEYSNLPNRIKPKYKDWESGKIMPTWNQLCDISRYFKRPTAFFFREKFPEHENLEFIEYRKLNHYESSQKSPALTLGIREAMTRRKIFLELMEEMHNPTTSFSQFRLNSRNTQELANHIRSVLDVELHEQKTWLYNNGQKDTAHYNFINNWKDQISSKLGVLVFEIPRISLGEMRALCIYFDKHPIILLNSADSPNGRIFSIFHELTHLILGESAICDVDKSNSKEWLCNSTAAQFLVPEEDLLKNPIVLKNNTQEWSDRELWELSNEYGVSRQSLLLRLINLKKAPQCAYEPMKEKWVKESNVKKGSKGGSPVLNQLKYNGKSYSRLLLIAYENGIVSSVEFSQYMGLRLKHVEELSERLFG